MAQIIVYKKHNVHSQVQQSNIEIAKKVKEAFDGQKYTNLFEVKAQYTSKKELIIKSNSKYEFESTLSQQMSQPQSKIGSVGTQSIYQHSEYSNIDTWTGESQDTYTDHSGPMSMTNFEQQYYQEPNLHPQYYCKFFSC